MRDPLRDGQRQAHLFVIAYPQASKDDMLLPLFDEGSWQQFAVTLLQSAIHNDKLNEKLRAGHVGPFSPDMDTLQSFDLRAGGVALTSWGMTTGRRVRSESIEDETVAELELRNSGSIHAYMSRLSDQAGDDEGQYVMDSALVAYPRRVIAMARFLSERVPYLGPWTIGVGATGLAGTRSWLQRDRGVTSGPIYDEDEYVRAVDATYADLRDHPGQLTDRLIGSLLRTYRVNGVFAEALTD